MKQELITMLACPMCEGSLEIESVSTVFEIAGSQHINDGVLTCKQGHRFPVIGEVPRLVRLDQFSAEERAALSSPLAPEPLQIEPTVVDSTLAEERVRDAVEKQYDSTNPASRARGASHASYLIAEYQGRNKQKFVRMLSTLGFAPTTILDVGGSLPGFSSCLADEFEPRVAVVADLSIGHAEVFRSADRRIGLIRADAQTLPFKPASFDLVVSTFLLEHVPDWKKAVESMASVGNEVFLAYGPNRWFPFELGHLDSPLAGTLPKPLAKYAAYVWLNLRGKGRSLESIEHILDGMNYISSRQFRRHCNSLGLDVANVLARIVDEIAADDEAPSTGLRKLVHSFPRMAHSLAVILEAIGLEPQVYHVVSHRDRRPMRS